MNRTDPIPTRASLLSRIRDPENHDGWRTFLDIYGKLIFGTAIKAGLTQTEAEEVVQETVVSVAKKMPGFTYDPEKGSFKGWLLTLTRWRIKDQFRKRKTQETSLSKDERLAEAENANSHDPLAGFWETEWEKVLLQAGLERLKGNVDPRQFQIFHEYVIKERPVAEICRRLKVSATMVYLAKHRLGALLKKELQTLNEEDFL